MTSINRISNGSLSINTRDSQFRSSSNQSFQEKVRAGLGSGINLTNSALSQVSKPIPGSAALSASLSSAARNLSGGSTLGGASTGVNTNAADGDMPSLQDEMMRKNEDMLQQQLEIGLATTTLTTKSNAIKAWLDAGRTIGSNIR